LASTDFWSLAQLRKSGALAVNSTKETDKRIGKTPCDVKRVAGLRFISIILHDPHPALSRRERANRAAARRA
jgi:hypothetical protein